MTRIPARLLALALLLFSGMLAPLVASDASGAFLPLDFEAARTKAHQENKLVFVDAWATWCGPCKKLDATTWKDEGVVQLLREHTVAIKIDVDRNPDFAVQYKIEAVPTLFVFRPDGTEVARFLGYADAAKFKSFLQAQLK